MKLERCILVEDIVLTELREQLLIGRSMELEINFAKKKIEITCCAANSVDLPVRLVTRG